VTGTPVVVQNLEVVGTGLALDTVGIRVTAAAIDLTVDGCVVDLAGANNRVFAGVQMALPSPGGLSGVLRVLSTAVRFNGGMGFGIDLPEGVAALYDDLDIALTVGTTGPAVGVTAYVEGDGRATVRNSSILVTGNTGSIIGRSGIQGSGAVLLIEGNHVEVDSRAPVVNPGIYTTGGPGTCRRSATISSTSRALPMTSLASNSWTAWWRRLATKSGASARTALGVSTRRRSGRASATTLSTSRAPRMSGG
jgi:hypothetical protein